MIKITRGIDVSKWQGEIDFKKVKEAGYEFVIIRAGYGKSTKDPYYEKNYTAAKAAGLKVGAYLYSYAGGTNDAKIEAQFCKSLINGKSFDFPFAYDVEDPKILKKSVGEINNIINTWMNEMNGYNVSIYTSKSYAENWGLPNTNYKVWIAQWSDSCTYKGNYYMWQKSSKGRVNGIIGNVDIDILYEEIQTEPEPDLFDLARRVIAGEFGNGEERKQKLGKYYNEVQKIVNQMIKQSQPPKAGQKVLLASVPLYASSVSKTPVKNITGTYYIYDGVSFKGRYRITNKPQNCGKKPAALYVTGYVKL